MTSPLASLNDVSGASFDYVIIGGGTAALTLASRLSENPAHSVLVLEAGPANLNDKAILNPGQFASHFGNKKYDWGFKTVPQEHAGGRVFDIASGRTLGGSSAINFMCYTKPPKDDIDDWERLGNKGWNWDSYEKYSTRSEKYTPVTQTYHSVEPVKSGSAFRLKTEHRGNSGFLRTALVESAPAIEATAQETLVNMGIPIATAPLNGDINGTFSIPNTRDAETCQRSYSVSAYYTPVAHRKNLAVLVSALVSRIVTKNNDAGLVEATGVEFMHNIDATDGLPVDGDVDAGKQKHVVNAKKEVIVSAGALKSPQVLELSGIGQPSVLRDIGVPLKVDLPGVGENWQEHMFCGVSYELNEDVMDDSFCMLRDPASLEKHLGLLSQGKGIFSMGITGFTFTSLSPLIGTQRAQQVRNAARSEVLALRMKNASLDGYENANGDPRIRTGRAKQLDIQLRRMEKDAPGCEIITFPGLLSTPNPPKEGKKYFSFLAATNHNLSRGNVHAKSADPTQQPMLNPNYFQHDSDLQTFVEIVKFIRTIPQHAPFKNVVGPSVTELNPGPDVQSDEEIRKFIMQNASTTFHAAGTLSMMPREMGGCVDSELKVYGTSNIRVVDLSVVPLHFASHSQATAYTIAEKAADIIQGRVGVAV